MKLGINVHKNILNNLRGGATHISPLYSNGCYGLLLVSKEKLCMATVAMQQRNLSGSTPEIVQ